MTIENAYKFPACRGIQSGRMFYLITVPMRVLCNMLKIDSGLVMERSQREVNPARAKKFTNYLLNNRKTAITPTLTGVVETPQGFNEPEFVAAESSPNIGDLMVDVGANFLLFDGQHRATGINEAIKTLIDIGSESVPLMLFPKMTLEERQLAFTDINQNTSKPNQSISDAYNHREPLPRLAVELANNCTCFKNLVDFEHNSIGVKSEYLYPLKTVKEATALAFNLGKNPTEITEEIKGMAFDFWNTVSRDMGWSGLYFSTKTTKEIRESSIKTHSIMTKAIGLAGSYLLAQYGSLDNIDFKQLNELDFNRDSSDFTGRCIDPISQRMLTDATALKLTTNKLLTCLGCPLSPEMKRLELKYFPPQSLEIPQEAQQEPQETIEEHSDINSIDVRAVINNIVNDPSIADNIYLNIENYCNKRNIATTELMVVHFINHVLNNSNCESMTKQVNLTRTLNKISKELSSD